MEMLPPFHPPLEDFRMLARIVVRPCLASHLEMGGDHIIYIPQYKGRTLSAVIFDDDLQMIQTTFFHRRGNGSLRCYATLPLDLIAPDRGEPDGIQDHDLVDHPPDGRLPIY